MVSGMRIDDEVRLTLLNALLKKNAVKPSLQELKRITGYHKATIVSSLKFLEEQGLISGYGPKIDFRKFGYKLEVTTLLQVNLSKKDLFSVFSEKVKQDSHAYWFSGMLGVKHWNVLIKHIFQDVESYQKHMQQEYYNAIPGIYDLIEDREIIFTTEPVYKSASRTKSLIEVIKKSKGFV
ncbi:MAG: hypothetical protein Q7S92_00795 [Candidatus Diapherotrites archaeon]|nr:hypothetical protein [Candidatus Diapherotrites archaeon]